MKTKFIVLTTAAALTVGGFLAFNTHAAEREESAAGKGLGQRGPLQAAREKLGLSAEQVDKIKATFKAERENILNLISRMRDARGELRDSIHADNASEATVRAAAAKVAQVEADVAVERMKMFHQISPILTEEQRAKVSDFHGRLDGFLEQMAKRIEAGLDE